MWGVGGIRCVLTAPELAWLSLSKRNFRFDLGEFLLLASKEKKNGRERRVELWRPLGLRWGLAREARGRGPPALHHN